MQRGKRQDNFSGLKGCFYAEINHSLDNDDHPSPIVFLYDFSNDAVYLYCPACERAWLNKNNIDSDYDFIMRSSFADFTRCVPATKDQIMASGLVDLMPKDTANQSVKGS